MSFVKLRNWINENANEDITVLYPGSFKPTTGGHLDLIRRYSEHPNVNEVRVLVGPGIRNGIDQDLAYEIATVLTKNMQNVIVEKSKWPSPILAAYKEIEEATPGNYALAASSKGDDYQRVQDFTNNHQPGEKYSDKVPPGVNVVELAINADPLEFSYLRDDEFMHEPISASVLRNDVIKGDYNNFQSCYPNTDNASIKQVWDMLQGNVVIDPPKVKKPRKKKILAESYALTNKLFEFAMSEYGKLEKFEYEDDLVYYVDYNFGKAILTNEFVDEVGETYLNGLIGQTIKWYVIQYNPKSEHRDNRYRIVGEDHTGDEESMYESLNEAISSSKNTHMTHAEDLVVLSGKDGLNWVTNILTGLYSELKGETSESDMKLSVKIDGAPAIFAWSDFNDLPSNGIAMKGLFAKVPKVFTTEEEIEETFGDRPDLAYKLKIFLSYLPQIGIPSGEIWQGDFLFDDKSIQETEIDGEDYYAFHPNTIYYVIPKDSDLGKLIKTAEVGITWHTRYTGADLQSVSANYNTSVSELTMIDKMLMTDPYIKSFAGIVNFTEEESVDVESMLSDIVDANEELSSLDVYDEIVNSKDIISIFSIFQNSMIKNNIKIDDPSEALSNFIDFIQKRAVVAVDKLKSEKGKERTYQKFAEYVLKIEENKDVWFILINTINSITKLKDIFIKKLNGMGSFQTYLKMKEGGLRNTNQEGFAVSDIDGNVVKLVSREEFSFANFSPDVAKGWMPK